MRKKDELTKSHTCMQSAHPEEMVFVLLGRDPAAPVAIRAWIEERLRLGKNELTDAQIMEALACAETMEQEGRKWVDAKHWNHLSGVLIEPLMWSVPAVVLVEGDLFHSSLSYEQIAARFGVMAACPRHKFRCTSHLPQRSLSFFRWLSTKGMQWEGASPCDWRVPAVAHYAFEATGFDGDCGPLPEQWPLPNVELDMQAS